MEPIKLENLSKDKLIKLARVYSRNWQTLDGLWFGNVEAACGLDAAARLDLQNWEKQAAIEARRIQEALEIKTGGLASILKVLSLMSWQLTSPLFELEAESPDRVIFHYSRCAVQEGRAKHNKPVFGCKTMKLTLLYGIAGVMEPRAAVKCLFCPPDPPGPGHWCRWELTLKD
ncbi:MAG: DUF6125 family protein [Dehalococcoidales bacterium]|nr:DUF6125 family protein [Dehalococcoidales bacterium]